MHSNTSATEGRKVEVERVTSTDIHPSEVSLLIAFNLLFLTHEQRVERFQRESSFSVIHFNNIFQRQFTFTSTFVVSEQSLLLLVNNLAS